MPKVEDYRDHPTLSERSKELLCETFVNEDHIAAFSQALRSDELLIDTHESSPSSSFIGRLPHSTTKDSQQQQSSSPFRTAPNSPSQGYSGNGSGSGHGSRRPSMHGTGNGSGSGRSIRVEKIKSLSDFAPVNSKVSKKRRSRASRSGWTYHLARWPLLFLIFFVIYLEFGMYVLTRQVVNGWEWLVAYTGRRERRRLRRKLRSAKSYSEWVTIAKEMDQTFQFEEWKDQDDDPSYDYHLVRKVRRSLANLRNQGDVRALMGVLEICLRSNFAGTENVRIYSETFYGTKKSVEAYVDEVKASLDFVRTNTSISLEEKRRFFRSANKNFGASALCLSGGAGFGYYHFGVVKAFLDAGMLPRVVTGTSAGGLVAALTCTRTDEELKYLVVPELADNITACEDSMLVYGPRWYKTGARFDALTWARKATFFTRGSLTFSEAYERTGRILNISVTPQDQHSPTILLNHLTAPNTVIWSAVVCSAAVPGILEPCVLMQKMKDGSIQPMSWGSKYKDGSLRVDIPLKSLSLLFNANFSIVSQVNPHIHLFFFAPTGSPGKPVSRRRGKGWRGGFLLSACELWIKLQMSASFKVIRDLNLMGDAFGTDFSHLFLQRFDGSITIWPRAILSDFFKLLSDPTRKNLERMIQEGQSVTWPKVHMVDNRSKIERAILAGRSEVRQAMYRATLSINNSNINNNNNMNSARSTPGINTNTLLQYFPLESDAERGIADRSTRSSSGKSGRAAGKTSGLGIGPAKSGHGQGQGQGMNNEPADSINLTAEDSALRSRSPAAVGLRKRRRGDGFLTPPGTAGGGVGGQRSRYEGLEGLLLSGSDDQTDEDGVGGGSGRNNGEGSYRRTMVDKQGYKIPNLPTGSGISTSTAAKEGAVAGHGTASGYSSLGSSFTRMRTQSFPTFGALGNGFGFRKPNALGGESGSAGEVIAAGTPDVTSPGTGTGQSPRNRTQSRLTRWLRPQLTTEPEDHRRSGDVDADGYERGQGDDTLPSDSSDSDEDDYLNESDLERAGRNMEAMEEDEDGYGGSMGGVERDRIDVGEVGLGGESISDVARSNGRAL